MADALRARDALRSGSGWPAAAHLIATSPRALRRYLQAHELLEAFPRCGSVGRPPKPRLSELECKTATDILARHPKRTKKAYAAAAVAVSQLRGAELPLDPTERRRRRVSGDWLRRVLPEDCEVEA